MFRLALSSHIYLFLFEKPIVTLFLALELEHLIEGSVRKARKPQNRTEIRQKTANRIGFFPEYRNRTYMKAHYTS